MPATKNPDGTITVTGTFKLAGPAPLAAQQQEAEALAQKDVSLAGAYASGHKGDEYTHVSTWKPV